MTQSYRLVLASQSPRRKQFLVDMGYDFTCLSPDIDESVMANESPASYVERLAVEKARCIAINQEQNITVLGSDTCVAFDGHILGKPESFAQCQEYLSMLSGNEHLVHTAIAVVKGTLSKSLVVSTKVQFDTLTEQDIVQYWQSGEPQDKAGAYGIQGIGGQFVKSIIGSYSAVVGLPLVETKHLLAEFGVHHHLNV